MKSIITVGLVLFSLLFSINLQSQENYFVELNKETNYKKNDQLKQELGIHRDNGLLLLDQRTDQLNIIHTRYKQTMGNIPVEGAMFMIHQYPDGKTLANGQWLKQSSPKINLIVDRLSAIEKVKTHYGSEKIMAWEKYPEIEKYQPIVELVWFDKAYGKSVSTYKLAYKIDVITGLPYNKERIFIGAQDGEILHKYDLLHTIDVIGQGEGLHNGSVEMTVDSIGPTEFFLQESNRHGGVSIFTGMTFLSEPIIDQDNMWIEDGVAVDAHWGAEKTIDYFYQQHNHLGLEGNGGQLLVNVHVMDIFTGEPMANAFWDGFSINIGDGVANTLYDVPFSTLDVVAHEITHGVTEQFANLIYEGESGGMNESFSDIFGVSTESYFGSNYNWQLGEQLGPIFRHMDNPNAVEMAAYYEGNFWNPNGDVHALSSIGNLWYYYLVEGGSGNNEAGLDFDISGIGFEKAGKIAFRCLTSYLTENSDYHDFLQASVQSAIDLYGNCSEEHNAVIKAWAVVGIGEFIQDNDAFIMLDEVPTYQACGLGMEEIQTTFLYQSCDIEVLSGAIVKLNYSINGGTPVAENFVTNTDLDFGDEINYTFNTLADLSTVGTYEIKTWVDYQEDEYILNDSLTFEVENKLQQNEDFAMLAVDNSYDKEYCGLTISNPNLIIQFLGCDFISAGEQIQINAKLGNSQASNTITLQNDLFPGDNLNVIFNNATLIADNYGIADLELEVVYPNDPFPNNNILMVPFNFIENIEDTEEYPFDDASEVDRFKINSLIANPNSLVPRTDVSDQSDAIRFVGPTPGVDDLPLGLITTEESDIWNMENNNRSSYMCMCVDASNWGECHLSYDLFIHQSNLWDFVVGFPDVIDAPPYYSNMRILIDGIPVSDTYGDTGSLFVHHEHDLSQYVGQSFELCFQIKPLTVATDFDFDRVILDNIFIDKGIINSTESSLENQDAIILYPIPIVDNLNIELITQKRELVKLEIVNTLGRIIYREDLSLNKGNNLRNLNFRNLPNGIYFAKFHNNDSRKTLIKKFVKS